MKILLIIVIVLIFILLSDLMILSLERESTKMQWAYFYIHCHKDYKKLKYVLQHGIIHYYKGFDEWYDSGNYHKGYCIVRFAENDICFYDDEKILLGPFFNKILKEIETKIINEN